MLFSIGFECESFPAVPNEPHIKSYTNLFLLTHST